MFKCSNVEVVTKKKALQKITLKSLYFIMQNVIHNFILFYFMESAVNTRPSRDQYSWSFTVSSFCLQLQLRRDPFPKWGEILFQNEVNCEASAQRRDSQTFSP